MNLKDTIYKRQSIRKYSKDRLSDECLKSIGEFIDNTRSLNSDIEYSYDIVDSDNIKTILNWRAPHYLLIYSQKVEECYKNAGFIFQQVDLYLQSMNIGSCWLGMASPKNHKNKNKNHEFIISIAFGKTDGNVHRSIDEFKRKSLDEICDYSDEKVNVARLAPSATNSQPWYFTHDDDSYNIYRKKQNIIKRRFLDKWNQIDIGIALAHLYTANEDSFEYYLKDDYEKIDGHIYEGSFKI